MSEQSENSANGYNREPVYYCKECLSLKVRDVEDLMFCDDCGSTDIGETDIFTWEQMVKERDEKLKNKK